jgi:carboxylate-amine ligase
MIFGLHVHVGIESGEKAIAIFNSLSGYIPHLLALSASSPYFEGEETGLASCRVKIFESLPTAGLPYRLLNWAEFQRLMITLVNAKAIESVREIWWDIRPHPDFGTVEVRICDGLSTLDDIIAMTAMIQALVVWLGDQYDEGSYLPLQPNWIVRENKWRASRWALDAEMIVDEEGHLEPLVEGIDRLIGSLESVSRRLGCHAELMRVRDMMTKGPSYARQRQVYAETGDFRQVVSSVVRELRESVPVAASQLE